MWGHIIKYSVGSLRWLGRLTTGVTYKGSQLVLSAMFPGVAHRITGYLLTAPFFLRFVGYMQYYHAIRIGATRMQPHASRYHNALQTILRQITGMQPVQLQTIQRASQSHRVAVDILNKNAPSIRALADLVKAFESRDPAAISKAQAEAHRLFAMDLDRAFGSMLNSNSVHAMMGKLNQLPKELWNNASATTQSITQYFGSGDAWLSHYWNVGATQASRLNNPAFAEMFVDVINPTGKTQLVVAYTSAPSWAIFSKGFASASSYLVWRYFTATGEEIQLEELNDNMEDVGSSIRELTATLEARLAHPPEEENPDNHYITAAADITKGQIAMCSRLIDEVMRKATKEGKPIKPGDPAHIIITSALTEIEGCEARLRALFPGSQIKVINAGPNMRFDGVSSFTPVAPEGTTMGIVAIPDTVFSEEADRDRRMIAQSAYQISLPAELPGGIPSRGAQMNDQGWLIKPPDAMLHSATPGRQYNDTILRRTYLQYMVTFRSPKSSQNTDVNYSHRYTTAVRRLGELSKADFQRLWELSNSQGE